MRYALLLFLCAFIHPAWSTPVQITELLAAINQQAEEPIESLLQIYVTNQTASADSLTQKNAVLTVVEQVSKEKDFSKKAKLYFTAGWLSKNWTSNYAYAVYYFDLSFDLAEKAGLRSLMASAMLQAMQVFVDLAMYQDALQYLFKAELVFQKYNYEGFRSVTGSLFSIGQFFYRAGNHEQSVQYFEKALIFNDLYDDEIEVMRAYNTLGLSYLRLGDHQKAIEVFQISNQMAKELGDLSWEALTYGNIGMVFAERKEFQDAIAHLTYDIETSERQKGWVSACNAAVLLAEVYLELNDLKSARLIMTKAIEFEQKEPSSYLKRMLAALKSQFYSAQQDYKNAFIAQKEYEMLHQELSENERQTVADQRQKRHAYELDYVAMKQDLRIQEMGSESGLLYRVISVLTVLMFLTITAAVVLLKRERKLRVMLIQDNKVQKTKWELQQLKKRISWQVNYQSSANTQGQLLVADDFEQLRIALNAAYDNFNSRLKMSYPELTEVDLKWIGLVKLKLSADDLLILAETSGFDWEGWLQQLSKKLGGVPSHQLLSLIQQL
ncbi:MAG: tetratricopeptide repeat protein [Sphingobacteriaceae bacterium]|nr:tetratricopeptide repeat protein [Sphingobacteriaceae bacterium]